MNCLRLCFFFRAMPYVDVVIIVYAKDKKMFLFNNILKKTGGIVQMKFADVWDADLTVWGCAATPRFLKDARPWSIIPTCWSVLSSVTWNLLALCECEYIIM